MLRLQDNEVIYNNSENLGPVEDMNYVLGGFSIPVGAGGFIPEEDCTANEQEVFNAYHEYYKDSGGIKPPDELSLEQAKQTKIQELNVACTNAILYGFEYTKDDITYLLGFDEQDQANLTQQMAILNVSPEPITWKVKGELVFLQFTRDEFQQMGLVAKEHKESKMQKYYQLCMQVNVCTDKAGVDAISW